MKKILFLPLIFLFASCEIQYDGETKLVVKGKIIDGNSQPIADQPVQLIVSSFTQNSFIFFNPSEENFIGKTKTLADGTYTMVIPSPNNFGEIVVEINSNENMLNQKYFRNIQLNNFENFELLLPDAKLIPKVDLCVLNVFPNQITANYELQKIEYIGVFTKEFELLNPYQNQIFFDTSVLVKKNQIIILKYTVRNSLTNGVLMFEQNVVIDNSNQITYTLNY